MCIRDRRQAVPLLTTEAPVVGTGMETKTAVDSGVCVVAKKSGTVLRSTSTDISIKNDDGTKDDYHLTKFLRSNQSNCYNQKPIVFQGEHVEAGQVIADGPSTANGELADVYKRQDQHTGAYTCQHTVLSNI